MRFHLWDLKLYMMASVEPTPVPRSPEWPCVQGQVCALLEEASLGMHAWHPPNQAPGTSVTGPGRPRWVLLLGRPHLVGCPR